MPPKTYADQWDMDGFDAAVREQLSLDLPVHDWAEEEGVDDEQIGERIEKAATR